jgi:surface antigen
MRPLLTSACLAGALLLVAGHAAAQPASPDIEGLWGSTMGQLEFNVTERRDAQGQLHREVSAPYSRQNNSKVKGELRGAVLNGHWHEPSSSVQCATAREGTRYWGRIQFTFNPTGDTFSGKWGYCEEVPERGWSGQREGPSRSAGMGSGAAQPPAQAAQPRPRWGGLGALAGAVGGAVASNVGGRVGGYTGAVIGNEVANAMVTPPPAAGAQGGGGCGAAAGQPNAAGRVAGAVGGALLDRQLSRSGVYNWAVRSTMHNMLVDGIACMLSPKERQQAAKATETAVQRGVGATSEWKSTDRPGVVGRSTVASEQKQASGAICRVVNDVVIVNGEETTAQKTMCRQPGATGFTLQT